MYLVWAALFHFHTISGVGYLVAVKTVERKDHCNIEIVTMCMECIMLMEECDKNTFFSSTSSTRFIIQQNFKKRKYSSMNPDNTISFNRSLKRY